MRRTQRKQPRYVRVTPLNQLPEIPKEILLFDIVSLVPGWCTLVCKEWSDFAIDCIWKGSLPHSTTHIVNIATLTRSVSLVNRLQKKGLLTNELKDRILSGQGNYAYTSIPFLIEISPVLGIQRVLGHLISTGQAEVLRRYLANYNDPSMDEHVDTAINKLGMNGDCFRVLVSYQRGDHRPNICKVSTLEIIYKLGMIDVLRDRAPDMNLESRDLILRQACGDDKYSIVKVLAPYMSECFRFPTEHIYLCLYSNAKTSLKELMKYSEPRNIEDFPLPEVYNSITRDPEITKILRKV